MKKTRIRFFILFTSLVVIFGLCLSLLYTYNLWKSNKDYVKHSYHLLVDIHEDHIKETVNQAILTIKGQKKTTETYYKNKLDNLFLELEGIRNYSTLESWIVQNNQKDGFYRLLVWDSLQEKLVNSGAGDKLRAFADYNELESYMKEESYYKTITIGNYVVCAYVYDSYIEDEVTKYIHDLFHQYAKDSDNYIWVNKILDYSGGDDYAVRLIHPNLVETEGDLLSTDMQDKAGNYPYYTELEKIKLNGELLSSYYFKKKNSDEVENKMSYSKLFPDYDWVVSTGVYLDEIDSFVDGQHGAINRDSLQRVLSMALLTLAFTTVMILIMFMLEWYYTKNSIKQMMSIKNKNIELENMAQEDTLTKLLNRRGAIVHLNAAYENYVSDQVPVSIAMGDLDNFKKVNDTYGHDVGDNVLIHVAKVIKQSVRSEDIAIRWGGEEILIVFSNTSRDEARTIVERIRTEIERSKIPVDNKEPISVTCSFGISAFYLEDKGYEGAVNRADKALYYSKQNGRNRITIFRDMHRDSKDNQI